MAIYSYQGRDKNGCLVDGKSEANSADQLAGALIAEGITPIQINELRQWQPWQTTRLKLFAPKIKTEELSIFCRQMHSLAKAGIPLNYAIQRLAEISDNRTLSKALHKIAKNISLGTSLSVAMQNYPRIFSSMLLSLIAIGEANGRLDVAFLQAAKHYELADITKKRIATAFRYPIFVIISAFAAVMVITTFVVPKFAALYAGFGARLPLPTQLLIHFSNFTKAYWPYLLIVAFMVSLLFSRLLTKERFRLLFDRYKLKIPILGDILERIIMATFSRSLAMLMQTGVPLIQSLNLTADVVNNLYAKGKILSIRKRVINGENFSQASQHIKFFSPLVLQMLSVGEETGNVDQMLIEASEFYEQDVDYDIKRLADKIEPLLLAVVGIVVLILALGVFLPMWDMVYVVH